MPTITRSELTLAVDRPSSGGRVRVRHHRSGGEERPALRAVVLAADGRSARVSLVPEGALLLAGDHVHVRIEVGAGVTLVLVEAAGTVAYDMRGGAASWDVDLQVGAGGALVWHGEPFVVATGAVVRRQVHVRLGTDARIALREVLVLGRHGEAGGCLEQRLDVVDGHGRPVLADGLEVGPGRGRLGWGDLKALGSILTTVGDLPPSHLGTAFALEAGGVLHRTLAAEAHRCLDDEQWAAAVAGVLR